MGRQNCFLPGAPSNLVTLLLLRYKLTFAKRFAQADDELREHCLQAFELFVRRCPMEVTAHLPSVIEMCLKWVLISNVLWPVAVGRYFYIIVFLASVLAWNREYPRTGVLLVSCRITFCLSWTFFSYRSFLAACTGSALTLVCTWRAS